MAKKSETKKRGAKSKYEQLRVSEKLDSVRGWAMHGGQTAVADALGVGKATITAWVGKYPEFAAAVKQGKIESNGRVLESAYDQAVGYYREVTELVKVRNQHTVNGRMVTTEDVVEKTYTKYFPPDPRMTQFVLSNRLRAEYQKNPDAPEETKDLRIEFVYESIGEDYAK